MIIECNSVGVGFNLPRPKGYGPLFIALKVISLFNLRPKVVLDYSSYNSAY